MPFEDTGQCVNCGYCCQVAPCPYGKRRMTQTRAWQVLGECLFLDTQADGSRTCALHGRITKDERNSHLPMFGCGCSSTLCNEVRDHRIREIRRQEAAAPEGSTECVPAQETHDAKEA